MEIWDMGNVSSENKGRGANEERGWGRGELHVSSSGSGKVDKKGRVPDRGMHDTLAGLAWRSGRAVEAYHVSYLLSSWGLA